MRKRFLPVLGLGLALFLTAFTTLRSGHSRPKAKESCMIAITFTNNGLVYTIPYAGATDGITTVSTTSVAPGAPAVSWGMNYSGTSLEFNVGFAGTHPAGRVRIVDQNSNPIGCIDVPRNVTVLTSQFAYTVFCGDHFYFYWEEKPC